MARKPPKPAGKHAALKIASRKRRALSTPRQPLIQGALEWQPRWKAFRKRYPEWQVSSEDPVYYLPVEIIEELRSSFDGETRTSRAFLDHEEAAIENAFTALCYGFAPATVGVWRNMPVSFEPLLFCLSRIWKIAPFGLV